MHNTLKAEMPYYFAYMEDFIRRTYTIGGMMIFPKRNGGINQTRGWNMQIRDRWDLTLECIRRYYVGQDSPLYNVLDNERAFFELFVDFQGYADFFFLQDCLSDDYSAVKFWCRNGEFGKNPLPKSSDEYREWIDNGLEFVERRNARIQAFCSMLFA